jgi:hypothetical protein
MATPPSARMHGASHRESDALPLSNAPEGDADELGEAPVKVGVAAGCQVPTTYEDALHCNTAPMLSEDDVDGLWSVES